MMAITFSWRSKLGYILHAKSRYHRAAVCLLAFFAVTACSATPGSFPARFTERGRLLTDGPPALMTPAAVAESQGESIPLLYNFALQTGQLTPVAGRPFPATTINDQQLALLGIRDWSAVVLVGEGYIDAGCSRFLAALDELERSRRATLANLNALQSATVGILGLAIAAQKTIGIVGIAFGLAASLVDNTSATVLYQLPASAIRAIVRVQRDSLRLDEGGNGSALRAITNQGQAVARLAEYVQYCVPVSIEANVARVLNNSVITDRGAITVLDTTPVVTSAHSTVTATVSAGRLRLASGDPALAPNAGTVVSDAVQRRKAALNRAIRATTAPATLDALAGALGVRFAEPATPAERQAGLRRAADAAVASAADMDRVSALVAPILGTGF